MNFRGGRWQVPRIIFFSRTLAAKVRAPCSRHTSYFTLYYNPRTTAIDHHPPGRTDKNLHVIAQVSK